MKTAVIICAAGQGKRMGLGKNKQFLELQGRPLLIHTLQVWESMDSIDDVVLVVGQGEQKQVQQLLHTYEIGKVGQIVNGGSERQQSVYYGLQALQSNKPDVVLIHDGARPFVTETDIHKLLEKMTEVPAAILAAPVKDTIKQVSAEGVVERTLDRSQLRSVQTPQAFHYSYILSAHEQGEKEGVLATDDAALMEHAGYPVSVVTGSADNIKLTTPEDITFAQFLLQRR